MADDLDRIEAGVVSAVAGDWSKEVETFRRALLALWSANGQRLTAAEVRALASRLNTRPAAVDAAALLTRAAIAGDSKVQGKTKVKPPSMETVAIMTDAARKPAEAVEEVRKRSTALDLSTLAGVLGVLGPLGRSANELRGAASFAVQRSAAEATIDAADQKGAKVVFVPERDACVECQSRAGETGEAVTGDPPPVHPHCRCEVQEYEDEAVPLALKREAVRSALRGFSLPSESAAARLRFAKATLAKRPVAPKSVQAYARAALAKGKFPRGRGVPGRR